MATVNTGKIVAERVEKMCKMRGITVSQMQKEVGLSNGYIRKLRLGQTPSIDKISMLADYFGVTSEFLTGAVSSFNKSKSSQGVRIPLLGRVAAGLPIEAAESVIGEEEIPARLAESADYFALLIKRGLNVALHL